VALLVLDSPLLNVDTNAIIRYFGFAVVLVHSCRLMANTVSLL